MNTRHTHEFKQALAVADSLRRRKTWVQKSSGVLFLCSVWKKMLAKRITKE